MKKKLNKLDLNKTKITKLNSQHSLIIKGGSDNICRSIGRFCVTSRECEND
ncbi:class I lanthipeptide [uncultured Aquimarina sp.]|uniref:class I lanthipeptide n=1 Tax=uncultured Aquimarina sp. TaxID=575652 RepID=UPI0034489E10